MEWFSTLIETTEVKYSIVCYLLQTRSTEATAIYHRRLEGSDIFFATSGLGSSWTFLLTDFTYERIFLQFLAPNIQKNPWQSRRERWPKKCFQRAGKILDIYVYRRTSSHCAYVHRVSRALAHPQHTNSTTRGRVYRFVANDLRDIGRHVRSILPNGSSNFHFAPVMLTYVCPSFLSGFSLLRLGCHFWPLSFPFPPSSLF